MAENVYEALYLVDSNRYAQDPNGVADSLTEMVEKLNGEILASRLWSERRLAYAVNGHRKGTYWLMYFRMDSQDLTKHDRACQLNDNILREMILKVEPRLVETLVAHAQGAAVESEGSEEGGDEAEVEVESAEVAEST
ncbi:MAG: 30S ribosomal protein S6 [Pirellulaceae bacterium]|nr:30S ribosomal protein S6 [Pirellulaceae bacterium]